MCGIAVAIGKPLSAEESAGAMSSLRRRGPDAKGIYRGHLCGHHITLLHSRLSIIDLDKRSDQPLKIAACTLVFNGEIYNFVELRKDLKRLGHCFQTQSDSEVIIHAYRQWGADCVQHIEGMWAFALLDEAAESLFISRDRFGEKPLYSLETDGCLYFASEVKTLVKMSGVRLKANEAQIRRYLVNGYRSLYKKSETFLEGVFEVPPATLLEITSPTMADPKKYWNLEYRPKPISEDDAILEVKEHIEAALAPRLRADVPIAFCLSGGVDSTVLAAFATKLYGQKIHTFSIIDKDKRYNEADNIAKTVAVLRCDHTQIQLTTEGFWDRMTRLVTYHDAPVATISYYIHSLLSQTIHEHGYKVAISGTAADELFTGYFDHYSYWLAENSAHPQWNNLLTDWEGGYGAVVRNPMLQDPMVFAKRPDERRHIYLDRDKFNYLMNEPLNENFVERQYSSNQLRNRMLNELFNEVVPVILHEDDLNSMYWSVENRSPYLDSKLVEFAFSLPNQYLINNGFAKWLLRAAGKDIAPKEVIFDKRKRGFNASIDTLVDRSDPETVDRLLADGPIFDFVNKAKMEKFITGNFSDNSFSKFLFSFISARIFLENDEIL